jgi:hypothetical protein
VRSSTDNNRLFLWQIFSPLPAFSSLFTFIG